MTGFRGQPADGAYAARDADQQPLLLQFTDVPTDGHMGHAEDLRQLVNAYRPRCSTGLKYADVVLLESPLSLTIFSHQASPPVLRPRRHLVLLSRFAAVFTLF